ncbi:hypothetical protein [uncultured Enterobacter sp.]|uniref:hypothetical protein n=1 Tax=uncultured Enterobacter sp. TaxID=238202 RepID=UPI0025DD12A5|nr:hypothetical protein [uncultured Enterobacter sp.]
MQSAKCHIIETNEMNRHTLDKWLKKFEDRYGVTTGDSNVVGYALFNKEKRTFVSLTDGGYEPIDTYKGDLDGAFLTANMGVAFGVMMALENYDKLIIVPVIHNESSGLAVSPGSLDELKPD